MNKYMERLSDMLEQGLETYATSDKYRDLLKTMSKFHNYSAQNCLLILAQQPDASFVAGFDSWKRNFNRYVKKDSKSIMIKSPCTYTQKNEDGTEKERLGFKASYVFDISCTAPISGKPPVQIGVENLSGSVQNYSDFLLCLTSCAEIPIHYEKIKGKANGCYTEKDDSPCIIISDSLSEIQTIKTLIHEIVHSRLHSSKHTEKSEKKKTRDQRELEAESVAYIVCSHFGIDTSDYSFPYILSWSAERFREILKDSMTDIQKVSSYIIEKTNEAMTLQFPV